MDFSCVGSGRALDIALFAAGLVGGATVTLFVEAWKDRRKFSRQRKALRAEIESIRVAVLVARWTIAEARSNRTVALAAETLKAIEADSVRKSIMRPEVLASLRTMSSSAGAVEEANRKDPAPAIVVPMQIPTPVFNGSVDLLGDLAPKTARTAVDLYGAIAVYNKDVSVLAEWERVRLRLTEEQARREHQRHLSERDHLDKSAAVIQGYCEALLAAL